jgi:hypothetical protein
MVQNGAGEGGRREGVAEMGHPWMGRAGRGLERCTGGRGVGRVRETEGNYIPQVVRVSELDGEWKGLPVPNPSEN